MSESNTAAFELWPNPAQGRFTLTLEKSMPSEVVIYNVNGQIVKSQKTDNQTNVINVESLGSGVYFVEVKNISGKTVKKVLVK